jgi:hypothetical protein
MSHNLTLFNCEVLVSVLGTAVDSQQVQDLDIKKAFIRFDDDTIVTMTAVVTRSLGRKILIFPEEPFLWQDTEKMELWWD